MLVAAYPNTRLRRLRTSPSIRDIFQEHHLQPCHFIQPLFVRDESSTKDILTMPGVERYLLHELPKEIETLYTLGIRGIMLFPSTHPNAKDAKGTEALNPDNLICQAIRIIKHTAPEMVVFTDVALDPYTKHGHDGICNKDGYVENDATIEMLVKQSLNQVNAGADGICPSDMMDGRIAAIRKALEANNHLNNLIISYAVKYASCFYGPFRQAVGTNFKGDKKTYQLNPANVQEALREITHDVQEGADAIIIKPGLPYLDIIQKAVTLNYCPVWAYQVSGEYAMIKFAAQAGAIDESLAFYEAALSFKRAGANTIITYAAKTIAQYLKKGNI